MRGADCEQDAESEHDDESEPCAQSEQDDALATDSGQPDRDEATGSKKDEATGSIKTLVEYFKKGT